MKKYSYYIHSLLVAIVCFFLLFKLDNMDVLAQMFIAFFGIFALGAFISFAITDIVKYIKKRNVLKI